VRPCSSGSSIATCQSDSISIQLTGIDSLLANHERDSASVRNLLGHALRKRDDAPALFRHAIRDARGNNISTRKPLTGKDDLHRARLAKDARQALCTARTGDQADADLRKCEEGRRRHVQQVAHERELKPAAKGVPRYSTDNRLAELRNALPGAEGVCCKHFGDSY
jgi:hypothetical protein